MKNLYRGELVRITTEDYEKLAKAESRWFNDSEYSRLSSPMPSRPFSEKSLKDWYEKQNENGPKPERYFFSIRTLDDDRLIGYFNLWVNLIHSEAWVGIGIGEREFWGKGYGTDMMKLCLQYAFNELNVYRVSLGLFSYNQRALRSYEKAGFRLEGCTRKDTIREGKRTDGLWMGILREEWEQMQSGDQP